MNKSVLATFICATLLAAPAVNAAKINLINRDPAGVGLNDTTPVTPIGNNPGVTRGEQARIVYKFATDMWGGVLQSTQTIYVAASFAPLA